MANKRFNKLVTAARGGSRLEQLETLKIVVAKSIDDEGVADRDRASFMTQYRLILKEIEEVKAEMAEETDKKATESSPQSNVVSDIQARREARKAKTA